MQEIIHQSSDLILSYLRKAVPSGIHYKPSRLEYLIGKLPYQADTIAQMMYLAEKARKCDTLDDAVRRTRKKFKLTDKQVKALLGRFEKQGISPIPLSGNFSKDELPSPTRLLERFVEEGCTEIDL